MFVTRLLNDTRGAAAAEMALILPLSILLLFTGFEAGHYYYQQHQVVKALRDGARYAARQSFDDINCRSGGGSINGTVASNIRTLTRTGSLSGTVSRISNWADSDITISVSCPTTTESQTGIFDAGEPAPQVNISTSFNYDSLFNGLGVITDSASIAGSQQATVMGI